MNRNFNSVVTEKNIELLTHSLDRLSLYDGRGNKKRILNYKNQNLMRILQGYTLEDLNLEMYF
jgi:hypothetical protein